MIISRKDLSKIQTEKQSIKHAQFEIAHMIRPMLETMRNMLRNVILWDMDDSKKSIELHPEYLRHPSAICLTCKRESIQIGNFWIARDTPHEIQQKCNSCVCALNQHLIVHYKLEYEYSDGSSSYKRDEMIKYLDLLTDASTEFAHFLMHVARSSKDDPFWTGIIQMITEENDICKNKTSNELNLQLVKYLRKLSTKHEERLNDMKSNKEYNKLPAIYELIQKIGEYPMVQKQMEAVRKTQKKIMKLYESKVSEDLKNTSVPSTTTS